MINREGIKLSLPLIAGFLFLSAFGKSRLSLIFRNIFGLIAIFILYFFRDPKRKTLADDNILYSPADGRITMIKEQDDGWLVHIFMSPFDVHINRAPCRGQVESLNYVPGKCLPAFKKEALEQNESNTTVIKNENFSITVRQISGILARKIVCWVSQGEEIRQGQKIGMIKFGSGCQLTVPKHFSLVVFEGEHVRAGLTPVAVQAETK
ncbi:MAG: phosphatidylserine decarboxylase [Candidatus Wallbacteria bacterium]|nr:phosphatidylserine decarboxylase [Candidatus Wallbacteria bacterium]